MRRFAVPSSSAVLTTKTRKFLQNIWNKFIPITPFTPTDLEQEFWEKIINF
jgi:hypothetical protein